MDCKFAYMKHDIEYVLCKKEPEPARADRSALFHAVCGHQAHCPKENCHKLTASWPNCVKLAEKPQNDTGERFGEEVSVDTEEPKKRSRNRRKPENEE